MKRSDAGKVAQVLALWPCRSTGVVEAQPVPALLAGASGGGVVVLLRRELAVGSRFAMGGSGARARAQWYVVRSCAADKRAGTFRVVAGAWINPPTPTSTDLGAKEVRRLFDGSGRAG